MNHTHSHVSFDGIVKPSAPIWVRLALTAAIAFSIFMVGCGGSSPTGPSATPSPASTPAPSPAPVPSAPFSQTFTGTVGSTTGGDWYRNHDFVVPRDGEATVTLTWASPSVDLDLDLTDSACTISTRNCAVSVRSTASAGTQERVARSMKAGESFRVFVLNFSTPAQAYTVQLEIK